MEDLIAGVEFEYCRLKDEVYLRGKFIGIVIHDLFDPLPWEKQEGIFLRNISTKVKFPGDDVSIVWS